MSSDISYKHFPLAMTSKADGLVAPESYFSELLEQCQNGQHVYGAITSLDDMRTNFAMHCIPDGIENKNIDHYEGFLQERRKLMALKIRNYYHTL